jgi:hypothetical protein
MTAATWQKQQQPFIATAEGLGQQQLTSGN